MVQAVGSSSSTSFVRRSVHSYGVDDAARVAEKLRRKVLAKDVAVALQDVVAGTSPFLFCGQMADKVSELLACHASDSKDDALTVNMTWAGFRNNAEDSSTGLATAKGNFFSIHFDPGMVYTKTKCMKNRVRTNNVIDVEQHGVFWDRTR